MLLLWLATAAAALLAADARDCGSHGGEDSYTCDCFLWIFNCDQCTRCYCHDEWSGTFCDQPPIDYCGAHSSTYTDGACVCDAGWSGDRCDTIAATASCDGSGGLTLTHRVASDPRCEERCNHCSAEQVLAAMVAAPHDYQIQHNGLYALGHQAHGSVASGASITDAGGVDAVMRAMAQFPRDEYMQIDGCFALASLANDSPANRAAIAEAEGAEMVEGAMARLSGKGEVQRWCQNALDALAVESCAHECGAHGSCANGQCVCDAGWSGDHCESLALGATLSGAALGGKHAAVGFCGLSLVGAAVVRRWMLVGAEAQSAEALAAPLATDV